jgi:hypothetical protein
MAAIFANGRPSPMAAPGNTVATRGSAERKLPPEVCGDTQEELLSTYFTMAAAVASSPPPLASSGTVQCTYVSRMTYLFKGLTANRMSVFW